MILNTNDVKMIELTQTSLNKKMEKDCWYSLQIFPDGFVVERESDAQFDDFFYKMDKKYVQQLHDEILAIIENPFGEDAIVDQRAKNILHESQYEVCLTYENFSINASADLYDQNKNRISDLMHKYVDEYGVAQSAKQIEETYGIEADCDHSTNKEVNKA